MRTRTVVPRLRPLRGGFKTWPSQRWMDRWLGHCKAACIGRAVGSYRAVAAPRAPEARRGSAAGGGPRGTDGDSVRPADRHPMAHVATGDGLRLRGHLLAQDA